MELQSKASPADSLELFALVLPDPDEELFVQHSFDLDSFTLFPKLATELRLKIWRLVFQRSPRHINIEEQIDVTRGFVANNYMLICEAVPITLSVNRESREETLRHFGVVTIRHAGLRRPHLQNQCCLRLPLCIMFGLDSVELEPAANSLHAVPRKQWLDHIEASSPMLLRKIERLEITCYYLASRPRLELHYDLGDLLRRFSGLKVLVLTILPSLNTSIRPGPGPRQITDADNAQIRRNTKAWIEKGLRVAGLENIPLPRICKRILWRWDANARPPSFVDEEEV